MYYLFFQIVLRALQAFNTGGLWASSFISPSNYSWNYNPPTTPHPRTFDRPFQSSSPVRSSVMSNYLPTQYDQQDHIPSSSEIPGPAGQWQTTAQPDANSAIQGCSCSLCLVTRHSDPPMWRTMEYQNPWLPSGAVVPFADRNISANNPTGIAAMTNGQTQFVAPQPPDAAGYAPPHEQARITQVQTGAGLDQAQVFNMSVMESLRRVARNYVNHPESFVNTVYLEPGSARRFRVVIILEVADIL